MTSDRTTCSAPSCRCLTPCDAWHLAHDPQRDRDYDGRTQMELLLDEVYQTAHDIRELGWTETADQTVRSIDARRESLRVGHCTALARALVAGDLFDDLFDSWNEAAEYVDDARFSLAELATC